MSVTAIDCDLRNLHAWNSEVGMVGTHFPEFSEEVLGPPGVRTVLFEIASPTFYRDGKGAAYQLARWVIFNVCQAARIHARSIDRFEFLVSPSSVWTKGLDRSIRHRLCSAKGKNKDLRECEAMIWFYQHEPTLWSPFTRYMEDL